MESRTQKLRIKLTKSVLQRWEGYIKVKEERKGIQGKQLKPKEAKRQHCYIFTTVNNSIHANIEQFRT